LLLAVFGRHHIAVSLYLHNEAFVSRVGMIDHLAGMHGMLLDATASICPDAAGNCIFPSY
jgi:hypothetical protein